MVHQVRALATKSDNFSLISGAHIVEGEKNSPKYSLISNTYAHKIKKNVMKFLIKMILRKFNEPCMFVSIANFKIQ